MVESQGKVSEKSGNFEMDIEWHPWKRVHKSVGPDLGLNCLQRLSADDKSCC